jgi:hypothetical protein
LGHPIPSGDDPLHALKIRRHLPTRHSPDAAMRPFQCVVVGSPPMKRLLPVVLLVTLLAAACGSKDITARATGIPATTTTSEALAAESNVLADCTTTQARPSEVIVACADANLRVEHLQWHTWKADAATGNGIVHMNRCEPNCAAGTDAELPAAVTLGKPVGGTFSELVVTWTGDSPDGRPTDTYELVTTPLAG